MSEGVIRLMCSSGSSTQIGNTCLVSKNTCAAKYCLNGKRQYFIHVPIPVRSTDIIRKWQILLEK